MPAKKLPIVASLVCCWLLAPSLSHRVSAVERPNVLLILADDLGYETVGCYGGTSYPTPHLDRLAASGMRFDRAYAMPLCTNTRIQLMTGKYNSRNWKAFGILDPQERSFGHLMQRAGYKTCIAGKWQLTSYDPPDYPGAALRRNTGLRVQDAGFDKYSLWHTGHTEEKGSRYADPVIEQNGRMLTNTAGKYGPDIWTDFICDFMSRHRADPFFVYYSMALPHNPMNPTPDSPQWKDPRRRHDDDTRYAADMIRYTDKMVGKLVAQLDHLGLREDTLILFFSDNGTNARVASMFRGELVRGEKGKGSELGVRVPMIANWKGTIAGNQTTQALIDSVDFLPTLLDVAHAQSTLEPDLDGISFAPILMDQTSSTRDHVYIHQDPRPGWDKDRFALIRVAINDRFKLYEDGRLHNVINDFYERKPTWIADDSAEERLGRRELQRVLDAAKPYPMFDPQVVPRPDPNAPYSQHAFQDRGGYVVIEAEQIPFGRDESWLIENHAPQYTGIGYLRSIREQQRPPEKGVAKLAVHIDTAGPWKLAVRCRSDHVSGRQENKFWIRQEQGPWLQAELPRGAKPGSWTWARLSQPSEFQLHERHNEFFVAPLSQNIKIDRIVLYQSDRELAALDIHTSASAFHPWARP